MTYTKTQQLNDNNYKTYTCSYNYDGNLYSFEVKAKSFIMGK